MAAPLSFRQPRPRPAPGAPPPPPLNAAFATGDSQDVNFGGGPSVMPPATPPSGGGLAQQAFPTPAKPAQPAGDIIERIEIVEGS